MRGDHDLALAAKNLGHQLAGFDAGLDKILAGKGQALAVRIVGVEGHNRNAGGQHAVDHRRKRVGGNRRDRQTIHLAHQGLDLADLAVGIRADRADELRVDLVLLGATLHAGLHERREFIGDVVVGDVDVERLAGVDLGLDALGQLEIGKLGFGVRRDRQQDRSPLRSEACL